MDFENKVMEFFEDEYVEEVPNHKPFFSGRKLSMPVVVVLCMALVAAVVILNFIRVDVTVTEPLEIIGSTNVDFGSVPAGSIIEGSFVIKNHANQAIPIDILFEEVNNTSNITYMFEYGLINGNSTDPITEVPDDAEITVDYMITLGTDSPVGHLTGDIRVVRN